MKTIRVISNIAYNTPEFFEEKMHDLVQRRVLDWAYWIAHKADIDELKDHIHFVCKPSGQLDTFDLRKELMQFDPTHPTKPLTCTTQFHFTNPNNMDDWLLYVVHDVAYLAFKGQKRNIQYKFEDLKATDEDALRFSWNNIDRTKYSRLEKVIELASDGVRFIEIVRMGLIPMNQYNQYKDIVNQYLDLGKRSGRALTHEEYDESGNVIDVPDGYHLSRDDEQIAGQYEMKTGYETIHGYTPDEWRDVLSVLSEVEEE